MSDRFFPAMYTGLCVYLGYLWRMGVDLFPMWPITLAGVVLMILLLNWLELRFDRVRFDKWERGSSEDTDT